MMIPHEFCEPSGHRLIPSTDDPAYKKKKIVVLTFKYELLKRINTFVCYRFLQHYPKIRAHLMYISSNRAFLLTLNLNFILLWLKLFLFPKPVSTELLSEVGLKLFKYSVARRFLESSWIVYI